MAELCRREGISPNLYDTWSKEFLEAGKRREGTTWPSRAGTTKVRTCSTW